MFIDIFGERSSPCIDCLQFGDKWYCTMNCGPSVPPEVRSMPATKGKKTKESKDAPRPI